MYFQLMSTSKNCMNIILSVHLFLLIQIPSSHLKIQVTVSFENFMHTVGEKNIGAQKCKIFFSALLNCEFLQYFESNILVFYLLLPIQLLSLFQLIDNQSFHSQFLVSVLYLGFFSLLHPSDSDCCHSLLKTTVNNKRKLIAISSESANERQLSWKSDNYKKRNEEKKKGYQKRKRRLRAITLHVAAIQKI